MIKVRDIYNEIDRLIPFSTAEKWDNCGLLAGSFEGKVTKVLTALDITCEVIKEAEELGAELIVSHHPIIFTPLRSVLTDTPTGMLLASGISAICTHTPFDMADVGMNKGLYDILKVPLGLSEGSEPLEDMGEGRSIGRIYELSEELSAEETAKRLKAALGCECVRLAGNGNIRRIAISSGAGNSFAVLAQNKGADALVSGDFKHDVLTDAVNSGFILIDCGHFYTERIFCGLMKDILSRAFPETEIRAAESCTDPVKYI